MRNKDASRPKLLAVNGGTLLLNPCIPRPSSYTETVWQTEYQTRSY
jgi:hypothetical protein